jgi:hypothetical protein
MLKQFLPLIFLSFFVVSCSYFENKSRKEPIQQVDTIVDFNTVDAFPLFPNCEYITSREKQQVCFQMEMSLFIYDSLKKHVLNAKEAVNDTVFVKLKVDSSGKISLSNIEISPKTKELLPGFDSIVKVSIESLPILQPAIKRDMPVTTEFTLPIILTN